MKVLGGKVGCAVHTTMFELFFSLHLVLERRRTYKVVIL